MVIRHFSFAIRAVAWCERGWFEKSPFRNCYANVLTVLGVLFKKDVPT